MTQKDRLEFVFNEDVDLSENDLRDVFRYVGAQIDFEPCIFGHFNFPTINNDKQSYYHKGFYGGIEY